MTLRNSLKTRHLIAAFILPVALLAGCGNGSDAQYSGEVRIDRAGDTKIARVGNGFIYQSDINVAAIADGLIEDGETLAKDHPRYQAVVDELVDQRLLADAALASGYQNDPAVRRRLSTARERLLANVALEKHMDKTVTEAAARELYEEQIAMTDARAEVKAAHILVTTEDEAKAVIKRIEAGEDFGDLARELSTGPSSIDGGDLGYFVKDAMVAPFAEAAFALDVGAVSAPVETQFGWHVIKVSDRRTRPVPSFEDMEEDIYSFMTYQEVDNYMTKLRVDGDVEMLGSKSEAEAPQDTAEVPVDDVPGESPDEVEGKDTP